MLKRICCFLLLGVAMAWGEEEPGYPRLHSRGQVHIQWDDGTRGAAQADDPASLLNGLGAYPAQDGLNIRRLRLRTVLDLNPDLEIHNEVNFDTRSGQVGVLDMYLRAQLNRQTALRAGMFKIPFGWEGLRSSGSTNTIEVSDMTKAFSKVRDSGLEISYINGPWLAGVAVVQGQGGVWTDTDPGKNVVGRLSYQLSPEWTVGGSVQVGSYNRQPVRCYGLEMQFDHDPWKFEAEYVRGDGYNHTAKTVAAASGFYLALVRKIDESNDLVLHYDRLDPAWGRFDPGQINDAVNARSRLVLGWNYYWSRKPARRLMINYEFVQEQEGPRISNNGLRIRYQFAW